MRANLITRISNSYLKKINKVDYDNKSNKKKKKVNRLYYFNDKGSYELKLLIELENDIFIFFDSIQFNLLKNRNILDEYNWNLITLNSSNDYIKSIKEEELTSYFIVFEDDSILYVYQRIIDLEIWFQDFEIVDKFSQDYKNIKEHMEENWVEEV